MRYDIDAPHASLKTLLVCVCVSVSVCVCVCVESAGLKLPNHASYSSMNSTLWHQSMISHYTVTPCTYTVEHL